MTELIGRTTAGRVHVVRHSFEPNKPFAELIEEFAGSHVRPRFLLHSTKEVYVDSVAYARGSYREEDIAARAAVERAKRHPFIIGKAAMRPLYAKTSQPGNENVPPRAYRMSFLPVDQPAFNDLAASLDVYPSAIPHQDPPRHYLFLDLPPIVAFMADREEAEETFKTTVSEGVRRRMFSATIAGLRSIEAPHVRSVGTRSESAEA